MIDAAELERAVTYARRPEHSANCACETCNALRVLLALVAEREAMIAGALTDSAAARACRASGRRAGLLEMGDWCDGCADGSEPNWERAMRTAASHARALAEKDG